MNTLTEIKNAYAIEQGYEDWEDLYRRAGRYDENIFFNYEDEVIVLAEKAALEKAAKNLRQGIGDFNMDYQRQKMSITNEQNLIR